MNPAETVNCDKTDAPDIRTEAVAELLVRFEKRISAACSYYMKGYSAGDIDAAIRLALESLETSYDPERMGGWSYIRRACQFACTAVRRKSVRLAPGQRTTEAGNGASRHAPDQHPAPEGSYFVEAGEQVTDYPAELGHGRVIVRSCTGRVRKRLLAALRGEFQPRIVGRQKPGNPVLIKSFAELLFGHAIPLPHAIEIFIEWKNVPYRAPDWKVLRPGERLAFLLDSLGFDRHLIAAISGRPISTMSVYLARARYVVKHGCRPTA